MQSFSWGMKLKYEITYSPQAFIKSFQHFVCAALSFNIANDELQAHDELRVEQERKDY